MSDQDTTAPDDPTAELAARLAEFDQDQPPTPEPQAQTDAPSTETSAGTTEQADTFSPFRLEDVPEEYRSHVEKAYKQLQGDYTRKTQSLAEERRQAEAAQSWLNALQSQDTRTQALLQLFDGDEQAVLAALGYETDDPTPQVEATDDPTDPRVAQLHAEWEQFKAEREAKEARDAEEAQLQRIDDSVTEQFHALAEQHGEISDKERDLVLVHALANLEPDEAGLPQITKAYQDLTGVWNARQQRWAQTKQAPHVPSGLAASQAPDLDNERDRADHMTQRFAEIEAAQGN